MIRTLYLKSQITPFLVISQFKNMFCPIIKTTLENNFQCCFEFNMKKLITDYCNPAKRLTPSTVAHAPGVKVTLVTVEVLVNVFTVAGVYAYPQTPGLSEFR